MKNWFQKNIKSRWVLWIGIIPFFFLPYLIINHMPMYRGIMPFILGEQFIPFIPWTFIIYISLFLQYILVAERMPIKMAGRLIVAFGLIATISFACFFILPVQFPRELYMSDSKIVALFRTIDGPGNCFPSLHVSLTIFLAFCFASVEKIAWKRIGMWIWSFAIIISVLTTKQHYVLDIVGAIILVIPVILIFRKHYF